MAWFPDVPDLPISKPKKVEELERKGRTYLDSIPKVEVQEIVDDIAEAVAAQYKKEKPKGNHERCLEIVSVALKVTGSAIGGHVGTAMIAQSDTAAERAAELFFPLNKDI